MYKEHPEWIKLILIRKVTDIAAIGTETKNAPKRFEDAFKHVPRYALLLQLMYESINSNLAILAERRGTCLRILPSAVS